MSPIGDSSADGSIILAPRHVASRSPCYTALHFHSSRTWPTSPQLGPGQISAGRYGSFPKQITRKSEIGKHRVSPVWHHHTRLSHHPNSPACYSTQPRGCMHACTLAHAQLACHFCACLRSRNARILPHVYTSFPPVITRWPRAAERGRPIPSRSTSDCCVGMGLGRPLPPLG